MDKELQRRSLSSRQRRHDGDSSENSWRRADEREPGSRYTHDHTPTRRVKMRRHWNAVRTQCWSPQTPLRLLEGTGSQQSDSVKEMLPVWVDSRTLGSGCFTYWEALSIYSDISLRSTIFCSVCLKETYGIKRHVSWLVEFSHNSSVCTPVNFMCQCHAYIHSHNNIK